MVADSARGQPRFPGRIRILHSPYRDNVTKSLGKHKLVFGAYFMNAEKNEMAYTDLGGDLGFDSTSPVSTGNAFADLLMGNIANFSQASSQPKYHINFKIFEPYYPGRLPHSQESHVESRPARQPIRNVLGEESPDLELEALSL